MSLAPAKLGEVSVGAGDTPSKYHQTRHRHSGESRNPEVEKTFGGCGHWIPAFAGMTRWLCLASVAVVVSFVSPTDARPNTRIGDIWLSELPPQALVTLQQIDRGGPFPYRRDGVTFQNREHRLPAQASGYYREYTVPTPNVSNRGARRIIVGGQPPAVFYYTADHYRSFARIRRDP